MPIDSFSHAFLTHIATFVDRLPNVILTLLFGYIAIHVIQGLLSLGLRTARVTKALETIIQSAASVILWIGLIALVMQSLGLNQLAIAISSSVAIIGIGIATGANKLVSDILAALFLAKNRDFKIGQRIKLAEAEGQIHSVDIRKVRILSDDGTLYIIPNTKFDEQTWQIMTNKNK